MIKFKIYQLLKNVLNTVLWEFCFSLFKTTLKTYLPSFETKSN